MKRIFTQLKRLYVSKRRRMLMAFFVSLMLCLSAATTIIGLFSYVNSTKAIKEEVGLSNLGQIRQTSLAIDLILDGINRTAGQFVINEQINRLAEAKGYASAYELNEILSQIGIINYSNKVIYSIYIYFPQISYLINSYDHAIHRVDDYYDLAWMDAYNQLSYMTIMPTRALSTTFSGSTNNKNVLTIIRAIPLAGEKRGAVIVNLDEEILTRTISKYIVRSKEKFLVVSPDGMIMFSSDSGLLYRNIYEYDDIQNTIGQKEGTFIGHFDDVEMLISFSVTEEHGWTYYTLVPTSVVFSRLRQAQSNLIILCFVIIFLGVFLAYILSVQLYRPLNKLLKKIKLSLNIQDDQSQDNEVGFLNEMFSELFDRTEILEQEIYDSAPEQKDHFFKTLILSDSIDEREYQTKLAKLAIPFTEGFYQLIFFEIKKEDKVQRAKTTEGGLLINAYIKQLIEKEFMTQYNVFTADIDVYNVGLIINSPTKSSEDSITNIMELCCRVASKSKELLGISLFAGMGEVVDSFRDIRYSYISVIEALKYKQLAKRSGVVYIEDVQSGSFGTMDWMYEKEEALMKFLLAGDRENCHVIIHRIANSLKSQRLSFDIVSAIMMRMNRSLQKLTNDLCLSKAQIEPVQTEFLKRINDFETADDMIQSFADLLDAVFQELMCSKTEKYAQKIDAVVQMINKSYQQDISVDQAAETAGLSASYFSRLFKERTGKTFVEYLTDVRMAMAKKLLEETDILIGEIARKTGFANQTYFISSFKNYCGTTPKNYRDIQRWKANGFQQ